MTRMGAENSLAAFAVWVAIMLPSAAFGGDDAVIRDGLHASEVKILASDVHASEIVAVGCTQDGLAADRLALKTRA